MKPVIYQLIPRLFANPCANCVPNGSIEQNGSGKMNSITGTALRSLKKLGITHIWYTGIIEHANATDYSRYGIKKCNSHVVKGKAGSPYAILDYYDVDPDIADDVPNRIGEFRSLVERSHKEGLKVILDFIPNHLAREYRSDAKPEGIADFGENDDKTCFFKRDNNFYYILGHDFTPSIDLGEDADAYRESPAKATGNDCFNASPGVNDWYETIKLNYGIDYSNGSHHFSPIPDTWHKMLNVLLYWAEMGIDGFRCDMVHMVPVEFWHWAIKHVKERYPHMLFIAEIYEPGLYRPYIEYGGFDYLYDKVTLYDTLISVLRHHTPASAITGCWQAVEGLGNHMLNFLENHDEQRLASEQVLGNGVVALPALVVSATLTSCPFMIYAGQELGENAPHSEGFSGQDGRTTIFDYWSPDTLHRWHNGGKFNTALLSADEKKLRKVYATILNLCNSETALSHGSMFDLMWVNHGSFDTSKVYTYLRHDEDTTILVAVNFSDGDVTAPITIPEHAFQFLGLGIGNRIATDLLTGKCEQFMLAPDTAVTTIVKAHNAVMWKFSSK